MDLLRSVEPAVLAPLRAQAERDLARRIVFGSPIYFAMVVIVAWAAVITGIIPRRSFGSAR